MLRHPKYRTGNTIISQPLQLNKIPLDIQNAGTGHHKTDARTGISHAIFIFTPSGIPALTRIRVT